MGFDAETIKKLEYAKQFEKQFGTPDPDHDWSMATLVKASVNLPQITGSAKMNIMTGDPRLSSTRLLAQVMLKDGQAQLDFDAIKGEDKVFVTIEQDGVYQVYHEYPVVNGILTIGAATPITRFAADCPSTVKDIKEGLFTNIDSNVKKYHWNDKYYSLEELRTWATAEAEAGRVTTENYGTTTPFNANCVSGGAYNFTGATLASSVIEVPAEGGYIFNGTFYTLTELREYAQGLASAGTITTNNYGAVPFNSDCVKSGGYDFDHAEIVPEKVTVVDTEGYWFKNTIYTKAQLEAFASAIPNGQAVYNSEGAYEFQTIKWDGSNYDFTDAVIAVPAVHVGDYIYNNTVCTWDDLCAVYDGLTYNKTDGPLTNIYFDWRLDFTNATVNEDHTGISLVAPGNSYIYNGTTYMSKIALQNYTEEQNLGNNGPFLNCFSGAGLDFSAATIDETKAPLEFTKLSIDLTYFKDVETQGNYSAPPFKHSLKRE